MKKGPKEFEKERAERKRGLPSLSFNPGSGVPPKGPPPATEQGRLWALVLNVQKKGSRKHFQILVSHHPLFSKNPPLLPKEAHANSYIQAPENA